MSAEHTSRPRLRIFTAEQIASARRQPSAIMEKLEDERRAAIRRMSPAERAAAFKTHNELMALAFAAGERLRRERLGRIEERDRFPDRPGSTIGPDPEDRNQEPDDTEHEPSRGGFR